MTATSSRPGFDSGRPLSSFFSTVYEVLVRPGSFFSRFYSRELSDTTSPMVFAVVCTVLSQLFGVIVVLFTPFPTTGETLLGEDRFTIGIGLIVTLVLLVVLALVYLVIGTVVLHLLTLLSIRQGEGIRATFVVVAYGVNAVSLFSWIPVIGYAVTLYGLYVVTLGLRETNGTTTVRALVPALIFVALQIALTWPDTNFPRV